MSQKGTNKEKEESKEPDIKPLLHRASEQPLQSEEWASLVSHAFASVDSNPSLSRSRSSPSAVEQVTSEQFGNEMMQSSLGGSDLDNSGGSNSNFLEGGELQTSIQTGHTVNPSLVEQEDNPTKATSQESPKLSPSEPIPPPLSNESAKVLQENQTMLAIEAPPSSESTQRLIMGIDLPSTFAMITRGLQFPLLLQLPVLHRSTLEDSVKDTATEECGNGVNVSQDEDKSNQEDEQSAELSDTSLGGEAASLECAHDDNVGSVSLLAIPVEGRGGEELSIVPAASAPSSLRIYIEIELPPSILMINSVRQFPDNVQISMLLSALESVSLDTTGSFIEEIDLGEGTIQLNSLDILTPALTWHQENADNLNAQVDQQVDYNEKLKGDDDTTTAVEQESKIVVSEQPKSQPETSPGATVGTESAEVNASSISIARAAHVCSDGWICENEDDCSSFVGGDQHVCSDGWICENEDDCTSFVGGDQHVCSDGWICENEDDCTSIVGDDESEDFEDYCENPDNTEDCREYSNGAAKGDIHSCPQNSHVHPDGWESEEDENVMLDIANYNDEEKNDKSLGPNQTNNDTSKAMEANEQSFEVNPEVESGLAEENRLEAGNDENTETGPPARASTPPAEEPIPEASSTTTESTLLPRTLNSEPVPGPSSATEQEPIPCSSRSVSDSINPVPSTSTSQHDAQPSTSKDLKKAESDKELESEKKPFEGAYHWTHPSWKHKTVEGQSRREPHAFKNKYKTLCFKCGAIGHHETPECEASKDEREWYELALDLDETFPNHLTRRLNTRKEHRKRNGWPEVFPSDNIRIPPSEIEERLAFAQRRMEYVITHLARRGQSARAHTMVSNVNLRMWILNEHTELSAVEWNRLFRLLMAYINGHLN